MKVSVIVAVYNGTEFLMEQLNSIRNQTIHADEVLFADDGSTDKSVELIKNFIHRHQLQGWSISVNPRNLGYIDNFLSLAASATGDVIFFCDQDDVWKEHKIEQMLAVYKSNSRAKAVISGYTVIDSAGVVRGNTLFTKTRTAGSGARVVPFNSQLRSNFSVGFALSAQRDFYLKLIPIIRRHRLTFDVPVGIFAAMVGDYVAVGEPLVYRRVHAGNVSGPMYSIWSRLKQARRHVEGRAQRVRLWEAVDQELQQNEYFKPLKGLRNIPLDPLRQTLSALETRNFWLLVRLFFNKAFRSYYWLLLADIVIVLFGTFKKANR